MPGMYQTNNDGSDSPPHGGNFSIQSWASGMPSGGRHHSNHVRSDSIDSLESNSSGSSGFNHARQYSGDSSSTEFIPTRTIPKAVTQPARNPLQFVKIQSSDLYLKAEQQIKLAKEVKITRQKLREDEEEWQVNLDSWKSRRKQQSEKKDDELNQETEEDDDHYQKQRKIKTFSEMMEERANKPRSYNFAIYESTIDNQNESKSKYTEDKDDKFASSGLDSYPSESETEGASEETSSSTTNQIMSSANENGINHRYSHPSETRPMSYPEKVLLHSDMKDDSELCSSEEEFITERKRAAEDLGLSAVNTSTDSGLESLGRCGDVGDSVLDFGQDNSSLPDKSIYNENEITLTSKTDLTEKIVDSAPTEVTNVDGKTEHNLDKELIKLQILLKHSSDSKGFGFTLRGGKDQGTLVFVDTVTPGGASDIAGLKVGDEIKELNGESCYGRCHSALVFAVKQAVYTGQLDLVIKRSSPSDDANAKDEVQPQIISRRGSAFAQRIAIFSSNSNNCNSQESKRNEFQDYHNTGDSIVLRRRSTFESATQNKEQTKSNRWSTSATTRDSNVGSFSVQDRKYSFESLATMDHSVELKPLLVKKLPPPVPAKPKSRMSASIESLHETIKESSVMSSSYSSESKSDFVYPTSNFSQVADETCTPMQNNELTSECEESTEISKSIGDNCIETLKELCKNCLTESNSLAVEEKQHSEISFLENDEKQEFHPVSTNSENMDIKPCGYSVTVQGDLNIVYESHNNENNIDDKCQEETFNETENILNNNGFEIPNGETLIPPPVYDQETFVSELNHVDFLNDIDESRDAENCERNVQNQTANERTNDSEVVSVDINTLNAKNSIYSEDTSCNQSAVFVSEKTEILLNDGYGLSQNVQADILTPVDAIAEQMELMILNQLAEQNDNIEVSAEDLAMCIDNPQLLLSDFDTSPRHFEPPKEKPPPPPSEETEGLQITVTSVARTNSTKRIKEELQKRRSNFLGLEIHDDGVDIDNYIPSTVVDENILKSEVELNLENESVRNECVGNEENAQFVHQLDEIQNDYIPDKVNGFLAQNSDIVNSEMMSPEMICDENIPAVHYAATDDITEYQPDYNFHSTFTETYAEPETFETSETLYISPENSEAVTMHTTSREIIVDKNDKVTNDISPTSPTQSIKRQHLLLSLGAVPKAKIIHENEWIKQNETTKPKRQSMPILEGSIYDTTPWHQSGSENQSESGSPEKQIGNNRNSLPPLSFEVSHKLPPIPPPKPSNKTSPVTEEVTDTDQSPVQTIHYVISPVSDSSEESDNNCTLGYSWNYEQIQPPDSREMSEQQQPKPNEICGACSKELGYGEVIIVDSVLLPYHSDCFSCNVCKTELNSQATIQFLNNNLACQTCVDTRNALKTNSPGESSSRL